MPILGVPADFDTIFRIEDRIADAPYRRDIVYRKGGGAGHVEIIIEPGDPNAADLESRVRRAGFTTRIIEQPQLRRLTTKGTKTFH